MKQALIIGASGGIGAALAVELAASGYTVTGLSRSIDGLDLTDGASVEHHLRKVTGPFDLVIVASGALEIGAHGPEKSLRQVSAEGLAAQFAVNAIGPALVMRHAPRLLPRGGRGVFAVLSARVGSISDNQLGGWYSYRMAKAALNMGVKTLSVELSRWRNDACITAIHPGTTLTPLSEPFVKRRRQPVRTPTETAEKIYRLVQALDKQNNGSFLTLDGIPLPW